MSINYLEEKKVFTLCTKNTAYQFQADAYGFLLHLYYGKKISGEMDYLLTYLDRGFSGNPYDVGSDRTYSMDALPQEFPCMGNGDYRSSALVIGNADGSCSCDLRYTGHQIRSGKYGLKGLPAIYAGEDEAQTLEVYMEDPVTKVQVTLLYGVLPEYDIITRSAIVKNGGNQEIRVKKAVSGALDFLYGNYDLITLYGRHAMERNFQRIPVAHGRQVFGSRRGTSSHQYNPAMILAEETATEDSGSCLEWSLPSAGASREKRKKTSSIKHGPS